MKLAALAVLLLSSVVRAAEVVYEHPALKVRLTVLTVDGRPRRTRSPTRGRWDFI